MLTGKASVRGRGRGRGRARARGRGRERGISPRTDHPSPGPGPRPGPVRTQNQIPGDWTDVEDLRFRLNTFNLGLNVRDDQVNSPQSELKIQLDASCCLQNTEFVQELKRVCREKRKQLGDLNNKPKPSYETVIKDQIQCALDYYKDEVKGGDYEFVKCEKMVAPSLLVAHTNFYARLKKGTDSSPELFFAVLENGSPQITTHCCKLDPSFYSVDGSKARKLFEVLHCEHVKCTRCPKWSDVVIGPGDCVVI